MAEPTETPATETAPDAPPDPSEAEFKRQAGGGYQLDYGQATAMNDAVADIPSPDETGLPEGVEWADGTEEDFTPGDEDEEILFGPAEGIGVPDEDLRPPAVPPHVLRRLPTLARAAKDPAAPASLRAMYSLLAARFEREMKRSAD